MPIRIRNFGGLLPKASPRALPDDAAQTASNLQANTTEFRPLAGDTVVVADSGVTDPLTIFRLQRNSDGSLNTNFASAAHWKVYEADVNLVKGPLNDDTNDRYYLTYNDGTTPPRVLDTQGEDRQLGVPAPTDAPDVVVNVVDEFTVDDRGTAIIAARQLAIQAIRDNSTAVWVGDDHPGTTTSGYFDYFSTYGFPGDDFSQQVRAYKLTSATGVVSDAFSSVPDADFSWIFDPLLAPFVVQATSGLSWATAGQYYLCINFVSYGLTYTLDSAALTTQLGAIEMPGTTDGTKALTSDQVDELVDRLVAFGDPAGPIVKPKIDALAGAVDRLKVLLDGGARGSLAASTQAFYSKTDVAAAIADAKTSFANSVWQAAYLAVRSSLAPDYTGASNGGDSSGAY